MKKSLLFVGGLFGVVALAFSQFSSDAADTNTTKLEAVEPDAHEFMEYAFEPFFHELRDALSNQPANKKAWVPVKANSLVLAENGNLLMLRAPDERADEWNSMAGELRDQGKALYQAAKKRDYAATKSQYVKFVAKCNACHESFADGHHIQKPWK